MAEDPLTRNERVRKKLLKLMKALKAENSSFGKSFNDNSTIDLLGRVRGTTFSFNTMDPLVVHLVAVVFVLLGCAAIVFNASILAILLSRRRHVFEHVFYLLIANFTLIDILKGVSLIIWSVKMFAASTTVLKLDQLNLPVLRFCNLATVLNLLMITANEFAFIKYPFQYKRTVTNSRVLRCVAVSWMLSICFTIFTMLFTSKQPQIYMGPCANGGSVAAYRRPPSLQNSSSNAFSSAFGNITATPRRCLYRDEESAIDYQFVFLFMLIGFCLICLIAVVVCYTIFFLVIHRIRKEDELQYSSMRSGNGQSAPSLDKHALCVPLASDTESISLGDRNRQQVLRRHKYVIVIGSVILVYILYLVSYSVIQFLQFGRLWPPIAGLLKKYRRYQMVVMWILRILVGSHSILQPLCYFRMKEFRQIVKKSLDSVFASCSQHRYGGGCSPRSISMSGIAKVQRDEHVSRPNSCWVATGGCRLTVDEDASTSTVATPLTAYQSTGNRSQRLRRAKSDEEGILREQNKKRLTRVKTSDCNCTVQPSKNRRLLHLHNQLRAFHRKKPEQHSRLPSHASPSSIEIGGNDDLTLEKLLTSS